MRAAERIVPALVLLLGLHAAGAHASSRSATESSISMVVTEVCESRTINYITHTLPQQCLRTSWTSPTPTTVADDNTNEDTPQSPVPTVAATATTVSDTTAAAQDNGTAAQEQDTQEEELAASSFMSFEEWKEMMLRKSGQDPANIKTHKQREHRERDPGAGGSDADSFGEEGEISFDFDALAEKVSEITSSSPGATAPDAIKTEAKEEQVFYDDGKTQYYRSKDAGKTCKERFSYASFDAGATILKTSPGAKNTKAILVENKDSYMLLECRTKNKFFIVELSDDILVDTVVLANFEFFSSMIRQFRVSVSDRYPVKMDKWVDLGTFEARNSRDIQAFLIEHPQIYTKYIRIEILSHWGNEFYCPVSLLRVHGTRMLDTWKESSHDDEPEQIEGSAQESLPEVQEAQEVGNDNSSSVAAKEENISETTYEMGLTPWRPVFQSDFALEVCDLRSPTTAAPTPVESGASQEPNKSAAAPDSVTPRASTPPAANGGSPAGNSSASESVSHEAPPSQGQPTSIVVSAAPSPSPQAGNNGTASEQNKGQPDARVDVPDASSSATTTTAARNKTSSTPSSASASPTVQESFFKTVTKRLQNLESNTSLSLQYIEDQSRFLQDVLHKMERKQITRVDAFLDGLNKTVLSELRNVRTQYDQIWQSTVIALETQREQSQREIVALTSRLNVLADEVVFQKRMAILQSVLLLSCLVLVIFSRSGGSLSAAIDSASFPSFPQPTRLTPYRRAYNYGYGARGPDSPSSMVDSSPPNPDHSPAATATTATGNGNLSSTLAASALPRHLYATYSSYKDKSLPLTPPSEYSRESTPRTHLHASPEPPLAPASFQDQVDKSTAAAAAASGSISEPEPALEREPSDAEVSSLEVTTESEPGQPSQSNGHTPSNGVEYNGDGVEGGEKEQEQEEEEGDKRKEKASPPSRARSSATKSELFGNGLRKPLPALPEDPS